MEKLEKLLIDCLDKNLIQIVLSGTKRNTDVSKIKIRPIEVKSSIIFQITEYVGNQVLHRNDDENGTALFVKQSLTNSFKQAQVQTESNTYTVLVSKKGKITITSNKNKDAKKQADLSHNRKKKYILEEGKAVEFLVDLGIMNKEGKVINAKYNKFKQINRFLEFIDDIVDKLPKDREVKIIDFGCGKSYLTFAMYYFLKELKGYDVNIIGLDLKENVINNCNELSQKYNYDKLCFLKGDIANYEEASEVDMVVTLHACDTATDYALAKAIDWNAKVILSVPCCQHEVNSQIKNELLKPIFKYGILKERMSALITDGIRANLLEESGYETQILEFIDMEHTPKNLLIRAVKVSENKKANANLEELVGSLNVNPTLKELLR